MTGLPMAPPPSIMHHRLDFSSRKAFPIESPGSGDRPHWCFDGVAGIVRSGEPEIRRANSDPRRIRGCGCLCDSTRPTSRSACDYQRLQAKLRLSIKARG